MWLGMMQTATRKRTAVRVITEAPPTIDAITVPSGPWSRPTAWPIRTRAWSARFCTTWSTLGGHQPIEKRSS